MRGNETQADKYVRTTRRRLICCGWSTPEGLPRGTELAEARALGVAHYSQLRVGVAAGKYVLRDGGSVRNRHPNRRCKFLWRRRNIQRTDHPMIGSDTRSRGSISTESRTTQPPGSSSRARSCLQTRCHQLDEDSQKPRPSGSAITSIRWRSIGMTPKSSCQTTGAPTRHGSASKCAPCVGSVIRTNGESSRFMPPTVDSAAQTSERFARRGNSTVRRIRAGYAAVLRLG